MRTCCNMITWCWERSEAHGCVHHWVTHPPCPNMYSLSSVKHLCLHYSAFPVSPPCASQIRYHGNRALFRVTRSGDYTDNNGLLNGDARNNKGMGHRKGVFNCSLKGNWIHVSFIPQISSLKVCNDKTVIALEEICYWADSLCWGIPLCEIFVTYAWVRLLTHKVLVTTIDALWHF